MRPAYDMKGNLTKVTLLGHERKNLASAAGLLHALSVLNAGCSQAAVTINQTLALFDTNNVCTLDNLSDEVKEQLENIAKTINQSKATD